MRSVRVWWAALAGLGGVLGAALTACGGGEDVNMGSTEGGGGTGIGGSGATGGAGSSIASAGGLDNSGGDAGGGGREPSGPAPGTPGGGPVTSVNPVSADDECASERSDATLTQLDLFIMLDRSGSMDDPTAAGDSKWEAITGALNTFMADPESASIGAGFGYFALYTGSSRDEDDVRCDIDDYADPVVPIAPLGTNAAAIGDAMSETEPLQYTPTRPALAGAIQYASEWAVRNPTHRVLVVLATDGLPNACDSTVESVVEVARGGRAGKPSIPTYVIGVIGREDEESISNLSEFAEGGGTGSAFVVDPNRDAGAEFLSAMNAIRAANRVDCDFAIPAAPDGRAIDFSAVSVEYTPASGGPVSIGWVTGADACDDDGGWHYDDNSAPTRIRLCDESCTTARADTAARISVAFGCSTGGQSGSGGAGAGGAGAGATGGSGGGEPACLLDGQSCESADDCCGGSCLNGVCGDIR